MSLLMQALKKAEQAKRSQAGGDDLIKPSEEYDDVLELAPKEPTPHNRRTTDPVQLDVPHSAADISLEPIEAPPVTHDAASPELEVPSWNAPQDPADIPDAMHTAVPPAASVPQREGPPTANARKPAAPPGQAAREARADAARQRPRQGPPPPAAAQRPVAAAPLRAPNPRTMRMAALLGALFLILATFGFLYWRAVYGPGSSKNLPPVPMPGMAGSTVVVQPESGAIVVPPGTAPAYPAAPGYEEQAYTPPAGAGVPGTEAAAAPQPQPEPAAAAAAPATFPRNIGSTPTPPPTQAQPPMPGAQAPVVAAVPQNVPAPTAEQMQGLSPEDYARIDRQAAAAADAAAAAAATAAPVASGVTVSATTPVTAAPAPAAQQAAPSAPMPPTTSGSAPVQVRQRTISGEVNPALQSAYVALRQGDIEVAREQYNALLQSEPRNRDVLFGAAAIALRDRQPERAADIYGRLLDADPNDPDALAGLAAIRQADPVQTEARLRRMINLDPEAASALSALGNLYARQGRWSEAQQQYFKAYAVAPQSADNAFNLAVALDRINQPKLALTYYQRALALAAGGATSFQPDAVTKRIRELGGR